MIPIPKVALVGRPNVGKSTLFNRIAGRRKAIVDSRPGSTRDRNYAHVTWAGVPFELVDTGGLLLGSPDPLLGPAEEQAKRAIGEAEAVIFMVDARAGLLPDDVGIAKDLRKTGKKVILALNKVEGKAPDLSEFTRLGFDPIFVISAEHGLAVGDLLDAAIEDLPRAEVPEDDNKTLRVAIVGRPNVGKSSLLNCIVGDERALVSPVAGTTRDAVDSLYVKGERRMLFVDTAGIRKQKALASTVDHVSVLQAKRSIERSHVAVVLVDGGTGVHDMDATIAGYIQDARRPAVIALNKSDLLSGNKGATKKSEEDIRYAIRFLAYAPIVPISALQGRGIGVLLRTVERVRAAAMTRVATGPLNRLMQKATAEHPPKTAKGNKAVHVMYATQTGIDPPTFLITLNHDVELHFSYERYLQNRIRQEFGFEGAPIVLRVRVRRH